MISDSTRRRHDRNRLAVASSTIREGDRVTVRRANGETLRSVALGRAFLVSGKHAMIEVKSIPGNTSLARVSRGWKS